MRHSPVPSAAPARHPPLARVFPLAAVVGVGAGLAAVAFQVLAHFVVLLGLKITAGYSPGAPAGESGMFDSLPMAGGALSPWLLLVVITAGGVASGYIVYRFAPETEGHGTDAAIRAYHRGDGLIRPRVPVVKLLSSVLTLGTGGSGGREGPIAQIGAGIGSYLGTRLRLTVRERRVLMATGMGAGVAAIFRAPLAGAIFVSEVLYRDEDIEAPVIVPSFIACTTAYCTHGMVLEYVFGCASGFQAVFAVPPALKFDRPLLLIPLAALAVAMAAASVVYVKAFEWTGALFARMPGPRHARPAIGALATGLAALGLLWAARAMGSKGPESALNVLSFGYGILQDAISGTMADAGGAAVAMLVAVGLGKILTTSLTIGSGGSGGVFGPSMVIGGTLGGAIGLLFQMWIPSLVTRVDVFVILGMAGFFSAAAKVPLSTIIIVSELTGSYELLLPAMWVAAIAYLLPPKRWTIYRDQVPCRYDSPAHAGELPPDAPKGGYGLRAITREEAAAAGPAEPPGPGSGLRPPQTRE